MNDEALLREAIRLAASHSADGRNGPFGSVIARDGEIVGMGWNQVVEARDPTAHAEIIAIRGACRRLGTHALSECTIYCSCEPCPMCLSAIYWARIPRVVFGATQEEARAAGFADVDIHGQLALPWPERSVECVQMSVDGGSEVLRNWQKNPDRLVY
jgi:tRNA(Arg) A34 adenosine deaminase TadA